ncbi:MAG: DNA-binding protein [Methylocystaceae bacterium]|nr:MAG: DNA-binding protein [Methylocystaceae bacterium]
MSEILTLNEAAARLLITRRTLERWSSDGIGPLVTHIGPRRRGVLVSDLEAFLASRKRVGIPPKAAGAAR